MSLKLLHLCDSLFPLGAFAHSDGLEAAAADGRVRGARDLRPWLDMILVDVIGRCEGPAAWRAYRCVATSDWDGLAVVDETVIALRPSATGRLATRRMGQRLLTTWRGLYADERLDDIARHPLIVPSLPIAFAAVCACSAMSAHATLGALAYTRLTGAVSAAMRLAPIGQVEAHAALARVLECVPAVVEGIAARDAEPESFSPTADIAAMSQQYLESRLFRS